MIQTWRNLWRRRLRTLLTIAGIAVGTLALTMMGAMSEKINLLVDGALKYYGTRVIVQPRSSIPGQIVGPPLSVSVTDAVRSVEGVDAAYPTVYTLYQEGEEDTPSATLGFPPLVIGVDAARFAYQGDRYPVRLSSGRLFQPGERGVAIIGVDLARFKNVRLGSALKIRGRNFRIVGMIERTLTVRDSVVFVPLADGQEVLASALPPPLNANPAGLASEIEAYPRNLEEADALAKRIEAAVPGVRALPPGEMKRQFKQQLLIFNVIIIGSAAIAVVVGGLSVLNTMATSVSERTREIGIKKAVGAENSDILREFLWEATFMGLVGGLLGLAVGSLAVWIVNGITADKGVIIFAVTPRLAVAAPVFACILGAVAGLYPAWSASRRRPVQALRTE